MPIKTAIVRAAANTADNQVFTVAGFGTPKAALIVMSNATANDSAADDAMMSIGVTDGTRQFSMASASDDNIADSQCSHRMSNTACILHLNAADGTVLADGTGTLITDGLEIAWTGSSTALVTVYLFGGNELSAYAGDWLASALVNTEENITAPGFQPDVVLAFGSLCTLYDLTDTPTAQSRLQMGFVSHKAGTVVQRSACAMALDAVASADCQNRVSSLYANSNEGATIAIEIKDFDASGFSAWTRGGGGAFQYFYLALGFMGTIDHYVTILDSPTGTGDQAVTAPGFKPQLVLQLVTAATVIDIVRTTIATGSGSWGIAGFTADDLFTASTSDQDGGSTMNTSSFSVDGFRCRSGLPADLHVATFVSFDPTGWTLNFSTADATVRKWPTLVLEEAEAPRIAFAGTEHEQLALPPPGVAAY